MKRMLQLMMRYSLRQSNEIHIVNTLSGIICFSLITHVFGVESYGNFNFQLTVLILLSQLVTFGIPNLTQQAISAEGEEVAYRKLTNWVQHALLIFIGLFIPLLIILWVTKSSMLLILISPGLMLATFNRQLIPFILSSKNYKKFYRAANYKALTLVAMIGIISAMHTSKYLILGWVASETVFATFLINQYSNVVFNWKRNESWAYKMDPISGSMLTWISQELLTRIDYLAIRFLLDPRDFGFYSIASNANETLVGLLGSSRAQLTPNITKQNLIKLMTNSTFKILRIVILLSGLSGITILFILRHKLNLDGNKTYVLILISILNTMINAKFYLFNNSLIQIGKISAQKDIISKYLLLSISLIIPSALIYGSYGAAIAALIATTCTSKIFKSSIIKEVSQ